MGAKRPSYALCGRHSGHGRWAMLVSSPDLRKLEHFGAHLERAGAVLRIEAWSSSGDDLEGVRVHPLRFLS